MAAVAAAGIVLEICPTSNLLTKAPPDEAAIRQTFRAFVEHGVGFTIATDGPEMMRTHLRDEARPTAPHRRARRGRARRGEHARPRGQLRAPRAGPLFEGVNLRNTPFGQWPHGAGVVSVVDMDESLAHRRLMLTDRQRQVVELIAAGCSNQEVGERLGISPRTAKAHCDVIRQKLGVPRRRQIPVAYRLLTGDDPLPASLESIPTGPGN
jgi:DNA-binding CsgD family transcriptional regulator